jgi:hypothetical protein
LYQFVVGEVYSLGLFILIHTEFYSGCNLLVSIAWQEKFWAACRLLAATHAKIFAGDASPAKGVKEACVTFFELHPDFCKAGQTRLAFSAIIQSYVKRRCEAILSGSAKDWPALQTRLLKWPGKK